MKRINRNFLIFLLAVFIFIAASCGSSPDSGVTGETTAAESAAETEAATTQLKDSLPELDLDGEKVTLLINSRTLVTYVAEESGDIVNDAVFARNRAVEERFNVIIEYVPIDGLSTNMANFLAAIRNSVLASDGAYDVVIPPYWYGATLVQEGFYLNLLDLPYFDFEQPWWTQGFNEPALIYNKLYACVGDFELVQLKGLILTYFNKETIENLNLKSPYELVDEGMWTIEKQIEYAEAAGRDLDGDGVINEKDTFGFIMQLHGIRAYATNFGIKYIAKNAEGDYYIANDTQKTADAYELMYKVARGSDYTYFMDDTLNYDFMYKFFSDGKALFMPFSLDAVEILRTMDADFGLVPMPKYDENQEEHITSSIGCGIIAIPISATNPETSALVLEALSFESHVNVIPAYYEVALKTKYSRDNDSEKMLDIVRESAYYDFGFINNTNLAGISDDFGNYIRSKNADFASWYASKKTQYETSLDKLLEVYKELP